ncbi:MAG: hypothetical protein AAFU64_18840, partial [Bacteroidota bacterium]
MTFLFFCLLGAQCLNAQSLKNRLYIGTQVGYAPESEVQQFSVSPRVAYSLNKYLALGLSMNYSHSWGESFNTVL